MRRPRPIVPGRGFRFAGETMKISLDRLFQMELDQLAKEQEKTPDPDSWRWSPFDIRKFDVMLHVAYDYFRTGLGPDPFPLSIAEAGSGIGTKLYLAKNKYLMTEYGYEINDDYLAQAWKLGVTCEKRDLSDFSNQPIWSAFDIVYVARPFKNEIKEGQWDKLVQKQMRPGAVYMATFTEIKPYSWKRLYHGPFRGVWVKPDGTPAPETRASEGELQHS